MLFLGIDIGSTAVKACVVRTGSAAAVVARGSADYPTSRPSPEIATQDPLDWNRAAAAAVRAAVERLAPGDASHIVGICLSSQGGSLYPADENHAPLCDSLTWMDRRAACEATEVENALGRDFIRAACGWLPTPSSGIAKLLWLKKHEPELWAETRYIYTTEESVTGYLTGNFVTDPTGQVMTRLYDYRAGRYIPEALDLLGIREEMLPEVRPCGTPAGTLLPAAAADCGLPAGIPVYVGAHDQYCASVGSGVTEPGQLLLATGTAWVMFGVTPAPLDAPPYPAPCTHPIPGRFGIMTSLAGCGGAIGAYAASVGSTPAKLDREILAEGDGYGFTARYNTRNLMVCPLPPETIIPHRDGVCVPLVTAPGHTPAHTALAAMEGAAFEARILTESFERAGFPHGAKLVISGGASRSPLWLSIVSAVYSDRKLFRLSESDAPALGAAILAAHSGGAYASLAEGAAALSEQIEVPVDPLAAEFYRDKYARYREYALL